MFLNRFHRIYEVEDYILRVRALFLLIFNLISVLLQLISLGIYLYDNVLFYVPTFILYTGSSIISIVLLWKKRFQLALTITLASAILTILGGMFLGNPHGNMILCFPLIVILFLLFTNIRTTIMISAGCFIVMFAYFIILKNNHALYLSYAIDSVIIFSLFTIVAILTVYIFNTYIREKNELIKEIHHRVRNNLQVLCGLADLHRNTEDNSKTVLLDFQNRILVMSEVHNYIYQSENYHKIEFAAVIEKIVDKLKNRKNYSHIDIQNHSEKIQLPIETAIPCAMIFNEILNNAALHAFNGSSNAMIEIHFSKIGEHHKLTVKDNGVGMQTPVDFEKQTSNGFTLINILSKQIKGTFRAFNENGLLTVLEF